MSGDRKDGYIGVTNF